MNRVAGSFRDPDGHVFATPNKILRGISRNCAPFVREFLKSEFYLKHSGTNIVLTKEIPLEAVISCGIKESDAKTYELWIEHKRIPLITYPYEWSFESLKQAACLTLELLIDSLAHGYTLKDASAYNVQFIHCNPVFIDFLSFTRYVPNSPFYGYKQFCEQFLSPLCLTAFTEIEFNSWYRGKLDGLDLNEVSTTLPYWTKFKFPVLTHIHLHARAMRKMGLDTSKIPSPDQSIPRKNLVALAQSLHRSVSRFERKKITYWQNYKTCCSYSEQSESDKAKILSNFIKNRRINAVLDFGCNTGTYTKVAVCSGAKQAIGLDSDCGAIDSAVQDAHQQSLPIQYLIFDIANPSPNLGWKNEERYSLEKRLSEIDGLFCFALLHHIVIGRNIPIESFTQWLLSLAPTGLIEYVPKSDQMIKQLLHHREDIFTDYTQENFESILRSIGRRVVLHKLRSTERVIYEYER